MLYSSVDLQHFATSFKPALAELSPSVVFLYWRWFIVEDSEAMSFAKSMSSSMVVKSHQIPVRSSLTVYHPVYHSYSFSCFYICMVFWLRKLYWKSRGYAIKEYHEIKMFTKTSTRFINTILHTLWFGSLHRFATDKKNVWFVWPYSGFLEHKLAVRN